ncbi:MAG: zf-HC2 domain-containing protein [Oscillatoriales cyanobacterium C42_A2020_001]|nr:zf-HC2 domain-containing protein [Leptolyngbyaceae cyanobacterium C42_A2020_001]
MPSKFDSYNSDHQFPEHNQNQSARLPDVMQRDRFELLSAYLDGEVSADERRQVEQWLENDPTVQRLHARLLGLRQAFQTMPVPASNAQETQKTIDAVLERVDRRPSRSVIWGGIAIAAVAVGAITSTLLGENSPVFQTAERNTDRIEKQASTSSNSEPLLVALDKPLVSIPKTPVADTEETNSIPVESNNNIR